MLGQRIKAAREAAGLTQELLAQRSGVSLTSIKAYEGGKSPSDEALSRLGAVLEGLSQGGSTPSPDGSTPEPWDVAIELGDLRVLIRRDRRPRG